MNRIDPSGEEYDLVVSGFPGLVLDNVSYRDLPAPLLLERTVDLGIGGIDGRQLLVQGLVH